MLQIYSATPNKIILFYYVIRGVQVKICNKNVFLQHIAKTLDKKIF